LKRFLLIFSIVIISFFEIAYCPQAISKNIQHRTWIGLKLFPALLGGNMNIKSKVGSDDKLLIVIIYNYDFEWAHKLSESLHKSVKNINEYPIRTSISNDISFEAYRSEKIAGIFISEIMPREQLSKIKNFGIKNSVIIFSPFVNDVEYGVTAGLHITAKIKLFLNISTLKESEIELNKLFFKVSKIYE